MRAWSGKCDHLPAPAANAEYDHRAVNAIISSARWLVESLACPLRAWAACAAHARWRNHTRY